MAASVGAGAAARAAPAARGAVFHRRRTRDAGRARSSPARSTTPTASRCAGCCRPRAARHDLGIVPDRLDATRDALRRAAAQARPDRSPAAASRSARKTTCARACRPKAGSTCGRSPSSRASRSRSARCAAAMAREALFIGLPGNPVSSFVTFLLAVHAGAALLQGAAPRRAASRSRCAPTSTGRKPNARREFLRARIATRRRARAVPEPELGRADLDGVGRRPDRQPAGAGDRRAATPCSSCRWRLLLQ